MDFSSYKLSPVIFGWMRTKIVLWIPVIFLKEHLCAMEDVLRQTRPPKFQTLFKYFIVLVVVTAVVIVPMMTLLSTRVNGFISCFEVFYT